MAKNYMSENDYKNADYTNGKNASNKAQDKSQNKSQNKNSTNSSENCGKMLPMQIRTAVSAGYRC